jgi:hypothetical protein
VSDPVAYWAVNGLPALARTADLREQGGVADANAVFGQVLRSFEESKLVAGCELERIHPLICNSYFESGDLPHAIRVWVARGDADRFSRQGPGFVSEQTTRGLTELVTIAFDRDGLLALAPAAAKTTEILPPVGDIGCARPEDPAVAGGLTWADVATSTELAGSQPDGMCVTKAVGVCTQRLGMRGATVTPEAWQELSNDLEALPTGGAHSASMKKYFEGNGYAFSEAWSGPSESASTEAMNALARGCDVFLWYEGTTTAHVEVVTGITQDAATPSDSTVTTNSWGQTATTTVQGGDYSGKSDIGRYGGNLPATGKATFFYACKE